MIENYDAKGCGTLDPTELMSNALLQMGMCSLLFGAYIFTLYRRSILMRTSMPIQDFYTLNFSSWSCSFVFKCIMRPVLVLPVLCLLGLPFVMVHFLGFALGPVWQYLLVVSLPIIAGCLFLFTMYDKVVFWAQDKCGFNDDWE